MTDSITFTRYDSNDQRTSTRFHTVDVNAANFDAVQTGIANMANDLLGIVLSQVAVQTQSITTKTPSAVRSGHRELKWLITVRNDSNANLYQYELGPADPAAQTISAGGREYLDPASASWLAIQAEFAAGTIVGPDGNTVSLVSIELVGRNI